MRYNKSIISFIDETIRHYAQYDSSQESYVLFAEDLPEDVREEFSGLLIADHHDYLESLTINNGKFEKYGVPALIRYLKNPSSSDNQYDLLESLRESITHYHLDTMQTVIDERIEVYNNDIDDYEPLSANDMGVAYGIS